MGRVRCRSAKGRQAAAHRFVGFEQLESRCVLSTIPVGVGGGVNLRHSAADSAAFDGAAVATPRLSLARTDLSSAGIGGRDYRKAGSFDQATGGLSSRSTDPIFSDNWSLNWFGFGYGDLKSIEISGAFASPFGDASIVDTTLLTASQDFLNNSLLSPTFIIVSEPVIFAQDFTAPSLNLAGSMSVNAQSGMRLSMPGSSSPGLLSATVDYGPNTAGTFDPPKPPPQYRPTGANTPDAPSITVIPSSESTPAIPAPAASAAAAVANQRSTLTGAVPIIAAPSISTLPFSANASVTLGTLGSAQTVGFSDRIAALPPERSGSQFVAVVGPQSSTRVHVPAGALQHSSRETAALLQLHTAASLADIPLDLGRIEQTLTATLADIKRLSPELAGWLSLRHFSPLTVAFAAAAIGGGAAYYYLRRRNGRESNRLEDEESSSWIFSRLHSAASQ